MALHERWVARVWLTEQQKEEYNRTISAIRSHDDELRDEAFAYWDTEVNRQNWLNFWLPSRLNRGNE